MPKHIGQDGPGMVGPNQESFHIWEVQFVETGPEVPKNKNRIRQVEVGAQNNTGIHFTTTQVYL